jgi:hypothetical protein
VAGSWIAAGLPQLERNGTGNFNGNVNGNCLLPDHLLALE